MSSPKNNGKLRVPIPFIDSQSSMSLKESPVYILSASRTPIGSLGGSLSSLTASQIGVTAVSHAIEKSGLPAAMIEEVYLGNVLSAGVGQSPARQVSIAAGYIVALCDG